MITDKQQSEDKVKAIEMLIKLSKDKLNSNDVFESFSAILHAIRLSSGEDAILDILAQAKQNLKKDIESPTIEEDPINEAVKMSKSLIENDSILKDQGNEEYLQELYENGSSVVCRSCLALISRERWVAHCKYWCLNSNNNDMECLDVED